MDYWTFRLLYGDDLGFFFLVSSSFIFFSWMLGCRENCGLKICGLTNFSLPLFALKKSIEVDFTHILLNGH